MGKYETNIKPYMKEIEDWARHGASEKEIAGNLGVAYSTFRRYVKKDQELQAALTRGKHHARKVMEKALANQERPGIQEGASTTKRGGPLGYTPGVSGKPPMVRPDQQGRHRGPFERNKKRIYATQDVCGICGKPVDKSLKYPHPLAPCIDHIIPIAKGGHPSDIENLQLAHWTCNRQKSDKLVAVSETARAVETISNRILPQSTDWKAYRAKSESK